ncbi:MAG: ATP-binding protein [Sporolactobacillus sp.]
MRRPVIVIIMLCYYSCLFLLFTTLSHVFAYSGPTAHDGRIDLSAWNFQKQGLAQLNGTWQLYPNQLLTPEQIAESRGTGKQAAIVPGNVQSNAAFSVQSVSSGTYCLVISSRGGKQTFGLLAPTVYSASRIYMNGTLIGQSGQPSLEPRTVQRSLRPITTYFPLRKGLNTLIIQFSYEAGPLRWGITRPLQLGTQTQIQQTHDLAITSDALVAAAFAIIGVYFFGHFLQRRSERALLAFSGICLSVTANILWIGSGRLIYIIFPALSGALFEWLESISTLTWGLFTMLFLYFSYRQLMSRFVFFIMIALSFLCFSGDIWKLSSGDIVWLSATTNILHLSIFTVILFYTTYVLMQAITERIEGSLYLIIATLAFGVYAIGLLIPVYTTSSALFWPSCFALLFLIALSLMMAHQFANAFKRSERLSRQLIAADRMKDEVISRTSHEFRTPLNGMITIAQTLLKSSAHLTIAQERDKIELLMRVGYRLSNLINDILDLEKMKQGILQVKLLPFDIAGAIRAKEIFYQMLAKKKNLKLVVLVHPGLDPVMADENRFQQIMNNLVDNALKYSMRGTITISAKPVKDGVAISVADQGIGIPDAELQKMFLPYKRISGTQSEGSGLGLAIVRQLVKLQHGTIWAQSTVGHGSVFTFTLPSSAKQGVLIRPADIMDKTILSAGNSLQTPVRSRKVDAPTILVADDDLDNLGILFHMLENIPYNVIGVKNGTEALKELTGHVPDLIILDLMMPGQTGYDICSDVRRHYSLIDLPILVLTAAIADEEKHYALGAGANDILQKPYHFSEFAARVHSLIAMKKAAMQAANMETAFLQSQIRPHFLYNVLNSITALSYDDIERAREMTTAFAAYLRGSFDFQNTASLTSFRHELDLIKAYLKIQKMRFEERLTVHLDVPSGIDFELPPLIIQPLIENAVLHGISPLKQGGTVTLSVQCQAQHYLICVADNGIGMDEQQVSQLFSVSSAHVGLKNISSRLHHFYGTKLEIKSVPGEGTRVSIKVPIRGHAL